MKDIYNLALFGAGTIAKKIVEVVEKNDRLKLYAVASRKYENAVCFAEKHKISNIFDNYETMIKDDHVDLVYISTPTKFHYDHIKMCLMAGKNIICEKPFAETVDQVLELQQLAEMNNLLLVDALWSMYMPIMEKLTECTTTIGKIKYSTASLGYPSIICDGNNKLKFRYNLWDYMVYPLATTIFLRGEPISLRCKVKRKDGVTVKNKTILKYKEGHARLFASLLRRSTYMLALIGTKGMVFARKWWFGRFPIITWRYPFDFKIMNFNHEINGYEYELNEAINCLDNGKNETAKYPLRNTISVVKWAEQMELY